MLIFIHNSENSHAFPLCFSEFLINLFVSVSVSEILKPELFAELIYNYTQLFFNIYSNFSKSDLNNNIILFHYFI